jgi:hypothetical protein
MYKILYIYIHIYIKYLEGQFGNINPKFSRKRSSVVECVPIMPKTLGSIPVSKKNFSKYYLYFFTLHQQFREYLFLLSMEILNVMN